MYRLLDGERGITTMAIDIPFIWVAFKEIAKAIPLTLMLAIVPVVIGFFIGLTVTLIREYKVKGLYSIANGYVSFFRGTPAIMHIMLIYFGIPMVLDSIIQSLDLSFQTNTIPIVIVCLHCHLQQELIYRKLFGLVFQVLQKDK